MDSVNTDMSFLLKFGGFYKRKKIALLKSVPRGTNTYLGIYVPRVLFIM